MLRRELKKTTFGPDDMPELEIGRDFNYSARPTRWLFALYQGHRIRFAFEDNDGARATYRAMRRAGAEFMPIREERAERFIGAQIGRLDMRPTAPPTSITQLSGEDQ